MPFDSETCRNCGESVWAHKGGGLASGLVVCPRSTYQPEERRTPKLEPASCRCACGWTGGVQDTAYFQTGERSGSLHFKESGAPCGPVEPTPPAAPPWEWYFDEATKVRSEWAAGRVDLSKGIAVAIAAAVKEAEERVRKEMRDAR